MIWDDIWLTWCPKDVKWWPGTYRAKPAQFSHFSTLLIVEKCVQLGKHVIQSFQGNKLSVTCQSLQPWCERRIIVFNTETENAEQVLTTKISCHQTMLIKIMTFRVQLNFQPHFTVFSGRQSLLSCHGYSVAQLWPMKVWTNLKVNPNYCFHGQELTFLQSSFLLARCFCVQTSLFLTNDGYMHVINSTKLHIYCIFWRKVISPGIITVWQLRQTLNHTLSYKYSLLRCYKHI